MLSGAKHRTMPYRCREKECRKRFSVRTGTGMEASNISFRKWVIGFYLFATSRKGVSSIKLGKELGLSQKSAWFMAHRIREAMKSYATGDPFDGPVEVDETHVGGKARNMHAKVRRERRQRYNYGKSIVAGARDRATKRFAAEVVPDTTRLTLSNFIAKHVRPEAMVFTDESRSYSGLPRHESVNHSRGEYVSDRAHTQGIESFWACLKRSIFGTYHSVSARHPHRYIAECAGRLNDRSSILEMMRHMARGMVGWRMTYQELVAPS